MTLNYTYLQSFFRTALGDFLGLIFSVFDKGKLQMCGFQSKLINGNWERVEIPVVVDSKLSMSTSHLLSERRLLESLLVMQLVLINEDKEVFENRLSSRSYLDICKASSVYQSGLFRYFLSEINVFELSFINNECENFFVISSLL